MAQPTAILYTRPNCHLCEKAAAVLEAEGYTVEAVDIDADPDLSTRYGRTIPVVVIDGKERFRLGVSPVLLRRLRRVVPS